MSIHGKKQKEMNLFDAKTVQSSGKFQTSQIHRDPVTHKYYLECKSGKRAKDMRLFGNKIN